MDPLFSRMMNRYTKPMNPVIMEGMVTSSLKDLEEYLDIQIRSVCQGLPSCLKYIELRRCSSQEEYEENTRIRGTHRSFDLAPSSVYLVKLLFEFTEQNGTVHLLNRFLYLPFVGRAGIMQISGSKYHIVPVLSDKVFTPNRNSIFVRLTQDRNNMFRMYNTILMNGRRETRYVVWAVIYRSPEARKAGSTANKSHTLLIHYLFGKYGFTGAFKRYAGTVPEYGNGDDINTEKYPEKDWIIVESTGKSPVTCFDAVYRPTKIKLAVRKTDWSPEMEALIFGFYYVVDHFPDRFSTESLYEDNIDGDGVITKKKANPRVEQRHTVLTTYLDDIALWRILLGLIILGRAGNTRGEQTLYMDITEHFESLDAYLDTVSQEKLRQKGLILENYYDLLAHIGVHFNEMVQDGVESGLSVYGKNLEVLSYILYDILYDLTSMKFSLIKAENRRPITKKDVTENLAMFVKTGKIFGMNSGKIMVKALSYSGDHIYPGITAVIAEQENRAGAASDQTSRVTVGPQHRIDLSMVTVGSVLNLPKANPTPLARINPWVTIDHDTGTVIPNPELQDLIEENKPYFKF